MSAPENPPESTATLEAIKAKISALPKKGQGDALVYLEYLLLRYSSPPSRRHDEVWNAFSLSSALDMLDDAEGLDEGDIDYLEEWQ